MKVFLIFLVLFSLNIKGYTQSKINVLKPQMGFIPKLDFESQSLMDRRNFLLSKDEPTEQEKKELDKILYIYDETIESIWEILGSGCSWYCGGGPYKVVASSELKAQGKVLYEAMNVHDFSFKTAWVEGVPGYGIGEYVTYYFENNSPRINEIKIFNGYVKSDNSWKENSRVRKLELIINNLPYAILELEDTKAQQNFKINPPLGHRADLKDLILKFKILDVYKGTKYDDVAITEIYFDGLDVHCLGKGTQILMLNNKTKNIESIAIGDTIMTYEFKKKGYVTAIVDKIETEKHTNVVKLIFDDNLSIVTTKDHPFMLCDKGWSSLMPDKTLQYKGFSNVNLIQVGDKFDIVGLNGKLAQVKLAKIENMDGYIDTYTISMINSGNNFIANGFIVGIEELQ